MPDALSRAPLPTPYPEVNILVIPPSQVSCFLFTALGFDLCLPNTVTKLQLLSNPLTCINLACSTQADLTNTARPSASHKQTPIQPCFANAVKTPAAEASHKLLKNLPESTSWPDNFEQLRPLNFNRVEFAQKQRKDPWLAPLVQFLISGNSQKSIATYDQKVKRWVTSIAKRTKLIDGLLFYSDELMKNPEHLRLFVPSDVGLQRHILQSYHDSP